MELVLPGFIKNSSEGGAEHQAVLGAIANALSTLESDLSKLKTEMSFTNSTGSWLEAWTEWFSQYRLQYEDDNMLFSRTISSISEPKVTIPAVQLVVSKFLNSKAGGEFYKPEDILIYEPYVDLMEYSSRGTYSGRAKYPDGQFWDRCIMEITLPEPAGEGLERVVNKTKGTGILVKYVFNTQSFIAGESVVALPNIDLWSEDTADIQMESITQDFSDFLDDLASTGLATLDFYSPVYTLEAIEEFIADKTIIELEAMSGSTVGNLGTDIYISIVQEP
jgi:hypothetical protein